MRLPSPPAFAAALLALALLAAGCATPGPAGPDTPSPPAPGAPRLPDDSGPLPAVDVPHLEERALLLLLADREIYEPFTVDQLIDHRDPELRRELAVALGRSGRPEAAADLEAMLLDPDAEVRRAAVFGLGELELPRASGALQRIAGGPDREAAVLAVEALGKIGEPALTAAAALVELPQAELLERLVPHLWRFPRDDDQLDLARMALAEVGEELRAQAAYALARDPRPEAAPELRALLGDDDPWIRGWAARGLGEVGEAADLERLRPLLDDPDDGPAIQALRAARALIDDGRVAAPADWEPRLLELFDDPRPGVRLTAVEASAAWLLDPEISAALVERAGGEGAGREREVALEALAAGEDPRSAEVAAAAAASPDDSLRAAAARVAARIGAEAALERLAGDPSASVRLALLEGLIAAGAGAEIVAEALADPDPALRAVALGWLGENPALPVEAITRAMAGPGSRRQPEVGAEGVAALVARAEAEPAERGGIVAILEQLAREEGDFLLRRAAADGLEELGRPRPETGPVASGRETEAYRQVVQRTRRPRDVEIVTGAGTLTVRLDCPRAPLTCLNFLQLAAQGFFDGLTFHRVVPDFVVQGGDPRGDGWGGPGYTIRDEINRLRYRRGVAGMALAGPDTGGSQFFVTLSPQPHLDGGYTAFGEVVAGEEVLDRIVQGEVIETVVEVTGGR